MSETINKLCIIGTGLMGGSLALALRKSGFCKHITGTGRTEATLKQAKELGVIDDYSLDIAQAVSDSDLIVLCVPVGSMKSVMETIDTSIPDHAVLTDVGSAKQCVIDDAISVLNKSLPRFVPGHPIAGTEKSGAAAAFAELYQERRVILTPTEHSEDAALSLVKKMWLATGALVDVMSAEHHDLVLAGTSHLPHVLAYTLVDCLQSVDDVDEIFKYAAGGFRDFTRIASSDPIMWRDISIKNKKQILNMIERYQAHLLEFRQALENGDAEKIEAIFRRAKKTRDDCCC